MFVAEVLNLGFSADSGDVVGEVAPADLVDGDVGDFLLNSDLTAGLVAASLCGFGCTFVFSRAILGVVDLTPRPIGGGVAPSESSELSDLAVAGDERAVWRSLRALAAVSGLELTLSGAGVADD